MWGGQNTLCPPCLNVGGTCHPHKLGPWLRICRRPLGRNLAQQNTSFETPVIIAWLIPKALDNSHCTWCKILTSVSVKYNACFIVTLDVNEAFLEGGVHSLVLVSCRKSISPCDVLRNLTCGVISTTEWFHSKPQTTGGEKDFLDSFV